MTTVRDRLHALSRFPSAGDTTGRILAVAATLIAFLVAYSGVRMLEDHEDTSRAVVRFILATLLLIVAGRRTPAANWSGKPPPAGDGVPEPAPYAAARVSRATQSALWWTLLVAAFGLAAVFRLNEIRSLPYGIWFDEAQNGIIARRILDGDHPIFISGQTQLPALVFYVFAAALKLLGNSITSLRVVTAIVGMLNVVFVYLLARELFDHRVGVLAAFFLAVMRWHVNFSRFAMHGIFSPLFMVATFYFLVRGLRGKGLWNFAAAGVMVAVGLQTYYSFVLVPVVIALYLVHHGVFERVLPWSRLATGLRIFALGAVIVYAPLGDWALHHWDQFNQRADTVSITKNRSTSEALHVAFRSAKKHLLMFSSRGDRNGRHNIPGAPMLDTFTGFLFVLGAGYAFWRIKSSSCFLLLIWVAVTLQSGIWSVDFEAPQAYRTVAITPAIAMLAALPLAQLWRVASAASHAQPVGPSGTPGPRKRDRVAGATLLCTAATVTVVLLTGAARQNFHDYFDVQLVRADSWSEYSTDATVVAKEIKRIGPGADYRIAAVLQGQPTIRFLNPDFPAPPAARFEWPIDIPAATPNDMVYLLDATKAPFEAWLQALYPNATFRSFTPPNMAAPVVAYEAMIPRDQVTAFLGLDATYTSATGAVVSRRESSLNLNWTDAAPVSVPADATWTGVLRAPKYRDYTLSLAIPGTGRIILDGAVVAEGADTLAYTGRLYEGDHLLTVEAHIERPGDTALSWDGKLVPPTAFLSYPLQGHGLIASFYAGENWQGDPKLVWLDPFVGVRIHSELDEVARPFTATWSGFLDAPATGDYTFEFEAMDEGSLTIDGQAVPVTPKAGATLPLTSGRHSIEFRLLNRRGGATAILYWRTPLGPAREIVPAERFFPR